MDWEILGAFRSQLSLPVDNENLENNVQSHDQVTGVSYLYQLSYWAQTLGACN